MVGFRCCSWNRRILALPAKIKQATAWRKYSFGDVILTLSPTWMIIWVMNACYSFHRQSTLMYLRIKVKIVLWNGCEDRVASNYMIGLTISKILWNWFDVFQTCDDLIFLGKWSNHFKSVFLSIVSELIYSICAYRIESFLLGKDLRKIWKTLK